MKYFLLVFGFVISFSSFATTLTCSLEGTQIHYINGIGNTKDDARASINKVQKYLLNRKGFLDRRYIVTYGWTYNHTHGSLADFFESGAQRIHQISTNLGVPVSVKYGYVLLYGAIASIPVAIIPQLRPLIKELVIEANNRAILEQNDVNTMKEDFKKILLAGKKLAIISHSQGNIFTNRALDELETALNFDYNKYQKIISNIRFASPDASTLAYHNNYLTNSEDFINYLTSQKSNYDLIVPDSRYEYRSDLDTFANHGFMETYLFDLANRDFGTIAYYDNESLNNLRIKSLALIEETIREMDAHPSCPKAVINFSINPQDPLSIELDSTDPDDPTIDDLIYVWTFHDGEVITTSSKKIPRKYEEAGKYSVKLTVKPNGYGDFGPLATTEKIIEVGKVQILGCENNSELGNYHFNPDGTLGGFVSNTSTVSSTSYISPAVSICGESQVLGFSRIEVDLSPRSRITNSTIIDSTIRSFGDAIITGSTISNLQVPDKILHYHIYISDIRNVMFGTFAPNYFAFGIETTTMDGVIVTGVESPDLQTIAWLGILGSTLKAVSLLDLEYVLIIENNIGYYYDNYPPTQIPISEWSN
ncbi:MAG: PKD domain-containing protein [Bacteriovoracaceae bacterium]|nr:PKD domain-containing protein [Bacteriovoracaceae bacterium]